MAIPFIGGGNTLPGFTGGPANSSTGATETSGTAGGISSPIVIGGYKTDGSAAGFVVPQWMVWVAGGLALFFAYRAWKRR